MAQIITIYKERRPFHPLLGCNIHLDSRSWDYALQPKATPILDVWHTPHISILDQGRIGSCSGNGSTSCAYHDPFFTSGASPWKYTADEFGAQAWYHQNTVEDSYAGTWEPDDTGSDTTTSSKVAKEAGVCSGFQMSGDLDSSLEALQTRPGITGIPWYQSMFDAPSSGLLDVDMTTPLAGGHLLCVDRIITASAPGNGTGVVLVSGPNSWGTSWGDGGRWVMKASDWWALRQREGDCFFWTPNSQPAPTPTPQPTPTPTPDPNGPVTDDENLWKTAQPFINQRHFIPSYKALATNFVAWRAGKDFAP
jgi:hypothetical protein